MTEPSSGGPAVISTERLIALGRDREAAAEAVRDSTPIRTSQPGGPMDGAQQLDEIIPLIDAVVGGISDDQLANPTPCVAFTVTGVLEHMIGGATAFAPAFRGEEATDGAPAAGSPQARFSQAMAELGASVHAPGALERTVTAPFGEVPGDVFARFVAFDGLVHGWDLATATGQPYAPRDELVAEVDAFVRQALAPEMRDGDTFATEAEPPADASPIEHLVAFSGRTVLRAEITS